MSDKTFLKRLGMTTIAVILVILIAGNAKGVQHGIGTVLSMLYPFLIGIIIAYTINPLVNYITGKAKIKRGLSIAIVYIVLIALISFALTKFIPAIINSAASFLKDIDKNSVHDFIQNFVGDKKLTDDIIEKLTFFVQKSFTWANAMITNALNVLVSVSSFIMTFLLSVIISIYVLIEKNDIKAFLAKVINALFKERTSKSVLDFGRKSSFVFSKFLSALILEALIVGVISFIGFMIMGVKYALILSTIICVTNVMPYVGPIIGSIPAIVATLTYDPMKALFVGLFILVLQQCDANVIQPKLMGKYIGISPLLTLLSIAIGGSLMGIMGMIISIPIATMIKIAINYGLDKKLGIKDPMF